MVSLPTSHPILYKVLNGTRRTGSHDRAGHARARAPMAMVAAVALIALVGCGSSKPAYCSDRTKLENSIKGLTSLNLSSGLSGLTSQLTTIKNDATTLVSSAKSDFPTETSAVKTSVDTLREHRQVAAVQSVGGTDRRHRQRCRQRRELCQQLRRQQQIEVQLSWTVRP